MLTGCNCFQIWQRVLCVGMKGLVSAHFLCKLAWSIHSSPPRSPGLCHSAARFFPSAAFQLRGCCRDFAPLVAAGMLSARIPLHGRRGPPGALAGAPSTAAARALKPRRVPLFDTSSVVGTSITVKSGLQNEPWRPRHGLWPGASAARIIFAVAFLTDFK